MPTRDASSDNYAKTMEAEAEPEARLPQRRQRRRALGAALGRPVDQDSADAKQNDTGNEQPDFYGFRRETPGLRARRFAVVAEQATRGTTPTYAAFLLSA